MNKTLIRALAAVLGTTLIAWAVPASAQQGPVGQGLNDAGRAVKRGFQTAGQAVSGGFQKTRTSVQNMEVVSRVYSRLHWDKAMTGSSVEIEVQAGGVAVLTGVVPNKDAKNKALSLTADTVGVNEVVDQLTIAALTRTAPVILGTPPTVVVPPTRSSTIIVTPPATVVIPPPATTTKTKETDIPL